MSSEFLGGTKWALGRGRDASILQGWAQDLALSSQIEEAEEEECDW